MKSAALQKYENAAAAYVDQALAGLREAMSRPSRFVLGSKEPEPVGPRHWRCRIGKIQLKKGATLVCDQPCGNFY